jgi:hypothetical protein
MFQPVPLLTYSTGTNVQKQPSSIQLRQQGGSIPQHCTPSVTAGNISMATSLDQQNQPLNTGIVPLTIESSSSNPISDEAVAQIVSNSSVPEFLYQLTKMLTDDHRDIIEWSNAKIEVHNPHRLESEVLNKYFRHSKYASFQRQLNYFGFRKLAGKGKMAPCSYVNENATNDLRSLLRMKVSCFHDISYSTRFDIHVSHQIHDAHFYPQRKTSANTPKEAKESKVETNFAKEKKMTTSSYTTTSSTAATGVKRAREPSNSYVSVGPVAKIAVGKGVKHRLNGYLKNSSEVIPSGTTTGSEPSDPSKIGSSNKMLTVDPHVLAKAAVGKGIAHQFSFNTNPSSSSITNRSSTNIAKPVISGDDMTKYHGISSNQFTFLDPSQLGMDIESSLCELQNNYQNSLNESVPCTDYNDDDFSKSGLRRESSLVALAMIPSLGSIEPTSVSEMKDRGDVIHSNDIVDDIDDDKNMMNFIDFPGEGNII